MSGRGADRDLYRGARAASPEDRRARRPCAAARALAEVLALANPAAFGRSARVRSLVSRLARAIDLEESWEVEVAALLVNIGAVTLPPETAEKLYVGLKLEPGEEAMVERIPDLTRRFLANIPRLGVPEILR